ncbi:unnamed protein product [Gongylonema pulchrum]|uniref:AbLIM_anchor domain-containing protein n=1 Tax=Gongylonema pulchrum TaxID=637853 RepID=A0A183DN73_9BILA|nr:unnamed protein product [Gongylonema pulchrum]
MYSSPNSGGTMSQYGSAGYLNKDRDSQSRTFSPAAVNYNQPPIYGKHPDDYNRYETARSRSRQTQRHREEDERSRFSGYGDRPGSGVEFMPTKWHGGEIITNPGNLPRSLKPRRLYYSPIGDGVVAADGVEMKRLPQEMSPRIQVTHARTLDRGEPGQGGYNIYARTATHDAGSEYGSDLGGSGRDSRLTGGLSPGSDSYGHSGVGPGMSQGGREPDYRAGGTGVGTGSGAATGAIPMGYGEKDYSPKDYSNTLGNEGYPDGRADIYGWLEL